VEITEHSNDDRCRLIDLMTCIDCLKTMFLERVDPDEDGKDLICIAAPYVSEAKLCGYPVADGQIHLSYALRSYPFEGVGDASFSDSTGDMKARFEKLRTEGKNRRRSAVRRPTWDVAMSALLPAVQERHSRATTGLMRRCTQQDPRHLKRSGVRGSPELK
jgi:hypothetical protein